MQVYVDSEKEIMVGVADLRVGKTPQVIKTNLGSCIAVCLYSSIHKAGGLLHFMMAKGPVDVNNPAVKKAKYADTGILELVRQMRAAFGVDSRDLVAKIFGGAKVVREIHYDIGRENERAARDILNALEIRIIASKTGGDKGYKLEFELDSGKVKCQIFGEEAKEY